MPFHPGGVVFPTGGSASCDPSAVTVTAQPAALPLRPCLEVHRGIRVGYSLGDIFLSMLWFTLFIIWIWLLIAVFTDLFRSRDLGGGSKALWAIFVIVLPYLGVFVYLIARGHKMGEHAMADAQAQEAAQRSYIQSVAGSGGSSTAAEIAHLAELRDNGTLSEEASPAGQGQAPGLSDSCFYLPRRPRTSGAVCLSA